EQERSFETSTKENSMDTKPTHEQAELQLKLYDLRREARMRQARDWFFKNYHPSSPEEAMGIAAPGTDAGAMVSQVCSYWEQTCALLTYGLLHEDFFFETTGEFFGVWESMKGIVPAMRQMFQDPTFLSHLEKASARFEEWKGKRAPNNIPAMRQWMQQ